MDIFLAFFKEVLIGVMCALIVHLFQKIFLDNKKTTQRRDKHKGGSQKQK